MAIADAAAGIDRGLLYRQILSIIDCTRAKGLDCFKPPRITPLPPPQPYVSEIVRELDPKVRAQVEDSVLQGLELQYQADVKAVKGAMNP